MGFIDLAAYGEEDIYWMGLESPMNAPFNLLIEKQLQQKHPNIDRSCRIKHLEAVIERHNRRFKINMLAAAKRENDLYNKYGWLGYKIHTFFDGQSQMNRDYLCIKPESKK